MCRWAPPLVGVIAPWVNRYCAELVLPAMCSVVDSTAPVLSYQPRDPRFAFSKSSWNSNVPPGGGGGGAAVTVMLDVPLFPALVAVMVADPADTPVTTPLELTVAFALLLDQVTI